MLFFTDAARSRVFTLSADGRPNLAEVLAPVSPSGLVVSPDGKRMFVTCAAPESQVCIVDRATLKILETIPAGHTAIAPVLAPDGQTLYVCNRFNNDVSVIDLAAKKEVRRIPVQRDPLAADITKDGKYLLVANQLPNGRADGGYSAATVSVIDLTAGKVIKNIALLNGSVSLKDIKVSPDGKYAVVSHIIARSRRSTAFIKRGWINVNVMSILDLGRMDLYNTVLLDDPDSGAANPWGLAWTPDGAKVIVTHAGTHEVSIVDFPMVLDQLPNLAMGPQSSMAHYSNDFSQLRIEQAEAMPFLNGSHPRVKLPKGDLGPRAVTVIGQKAYVANYFSDTLSVIDLALPEHPVESIPLGPKREMDQVRKGEFYFHDASICFQGWQSCSSCHPGEARVDGLNWDLINDGTGNPKNTKNLLLAHRTPPAMSLGVRATAETAVRAGIKRILFTDQPEEVPAAIDAYLKSLKPVSSPYLVHGKLSPAAERGKEIFQRAGCATCHSGELFTDLRPHNVGTRREFDRPTDRFYTPTLIEVWRTAPYLHDGSAVTIREVITTHNPDDQLGTTSDLSSQEIDDLCTYVLSL